MNRSVFFFVCFVFSFLFGCDDAQQMVSPVIDGGAVGVVETPFPSVDSRYTGVLHRVGSVQRFGSGANDPVALEVVEKDGCEYVLIRNEQDTEKHWSHL